MKFGDEIRNSWLEKWLKINNLEAEDIDESPFEIGLTTLPCRFDSGELAANFVLSGLIGMVNHPDALESVWQCIYICPVLSD